MCRAKIQQLRGPVFSVIIALATLRQSESLVLSAASNGGASNGNLAASSIINDCFVPYTNTMTIAYHAKERSAARRIDDFLAALLQHLPGISVNLETPARARVISHHRKFNLIIVDSLEALIELDPAALTKDYDIMEYYLIYLIQNDMAFAPSRVIAYIFEYFWKNYIINVSLLNKATAHVAELYTYFPFTSADRCHAVDVQSINSYAGHWQRPLVEHAFPSKLDNLQNCSLKIAVWHTPPYLSYFPNKTGFERIADFEGELLTEIAKTLNFSLVLVEPPNNEQRGKRLENGTITGAMKLLQERKADLSLGSFRYTVERSEVLTGALPYYQTWQIYSIQLPTKPYTSLEILTSPFDTPTWICLYLSLQILMVIYYIVQRHRKVSWLLQIIAGVPKPAQPLLNIVRLFLGVPLRSSPQNNFARFFNINFFIYGVVMRAAYQSLLFKLMQTNMYRAPPQSLTDLIADGYTLVMTQTTFDSVQSTPRIQQGLVQTIITNYSSELETYVYIEQAREPLLAAVSPQDYVTFYVGSGNKCELFYVLPEKIFAQHITLYFTKHSYLIDRFNHLLMEFRSRGLVDHWATKKIDMKFFHDKSPVKVHAIHYDEIDGIFLVYHILMALACMVFSLELIWNRLGHLDETYFIWDSKFDSNNVLK